MAEKINLNQIDLIKNSKAGLFIAAIFIVLNILIPAITIGFPSLPQATQGERYAIIGVLAPIAEELIFGVLLMLLFVNVFKIPILWAILICSIAFMIFHAVAYAGSYQAQGLIAASGALFGAFLFRIVANYTTIKQQSPIAAIIMHASFNTYLIVTKLVIVGAI
jgi:membrane protease YdiL (CAAX protease family)